MQMHCLVRHSKWHAFQSNDSMVQFIIEFELIIKNIAWNEIEQFKAKLDEKLCKNILDLINLFGLLMGINQD
ncbi:hypothetical protein HYE00_02355 [Mycoplasmopsis bovis]|nr:hypothetical protein [Mycoplasmopsis bovis]QQH28718.1 hypothetical protein HYE00_02355 [Mycoplasmopsis bovis]